MVRLQSSVSGNSNNNNLDGGVNPHVLDQLYASTSGTKRARTKGGTSTSSTGGSSSSSLNYKISGPGGRASSTGGPDGINDDIVTPSNHIPYEKKQQQQQQQKQQQQQADRPKILTRSRGSGGVPPKKTKLELLAELQGMTEEQIMQALYNDPELAEVASEQIARAQQKKAKFQGSSGTGGGSGSSSSSGTGNANTKFKRGSTDRIDAAMKEKGIPYEQWALLLALLGIGVYHLYKALSGPTSTSASDRSTQKNHHTSSSSKKVKGSKKGSNNKSNTSRSDDVDKVAAEIEAISNSNIADASPMKVSGSKKIVKKKVTNKVAVVSSAKDGDSKTKQNTAKGEKINGAAPIPATIAPPLSNRNGGIINADDYAPYDDQLVDDEDTWKTVSKTKGTSAKATSNAIAVTPVGKPDDDSTGQVTKKQKKKNGKQEVHASTEVKNVNSPVSVETTPIYSDVVSTLVEASNKPTNGTLEEEEVVTNDTVDDFKKSNNKQEANTSIGDDDDNNNRNDVVGKENVQVPNANSNGAAGLTVDHGSSKKANKKKKKKNDTPLTSESKKNGFSSTSSSSNEDDLAADAALALQLQKEEELLSKQEQVKATNASTSAESGMVTNDSGDVWEEVAVKKKK